MSISLLWLPDLSLVSGKRDDVEVKETRGPTCPAAAELQVHPGRAAYLKEKGEVRGCRQVGRYLGVPAVPSAPEPLTPQWLVEIWLADPNKQTN